MANPCRFLAILGLALGLITAKICMAVIIVNGGSIPAEMTAMSVATLGALIWFVKNANLDAATKATQDVGEKLHNIKETVGQLQEDTGTHRESMLTEIMDLKGKIISLKGQVAALTLGPPPRPPETGGGG